MRLSLLPGTRHFIAAVILTSLHITSYAELNLAIPKNATPVSANEQQQTGHLNLEANTQAPAGYQTSDRCPNGATVTGIQNVNGQRYYKCERAASGMPPVVRDAERYERTPAHCMPGSMEPQCRSGSYKYP